MCSEKKHLKFCLEPSRLALLGLSMPIQNVGLPTHVSATGVLQCPNPDPPWQVEKIKSMSDRVQSWSEHWDYTPKAPESQDFSPIRRSIHYEFHMNSGALERRFNIIFWETPKFSLISI